MSAEFAVVVLDHVIAGDPQHTRADAVSVYGDAPNSNHETPKGRKEESPKNADCV